MTVEKTLERKLRESIKIQGGLAVKLTPIGFTGMPDRMVLIPPGVVAFAEIKSKGRKPTELQQKRIENLMRLGFIVFVIDSEDKLNGFLEAVNALRTSRISKICQ